MHHTKTLLTALTATAALAGSAHAATVADAGNVLNQPNWYSAGVGDTGYIFWGAGESASELVGGELDGGYISHTNESDAGNFMTGGDTRIDLEDPDGGTFTAGYRPANWSHSVTSFEDHSTFTFGAGTPSTLALAVLVGAMDDANGNPIDVPDSLRVTGDNAAAVETIAPDQNQADWYIFELTGISEGDSVTLAATAIQNGGGHGYSPINGVAFAPQVVPEPSSIALLGLGGLLVARRRRG